MAPKEFGAHLGKAAAKKSPILTQLIEAKEHSDKRRYKLKHAILRDLLRKYPQQFMVDSNGTNRILGITHNPTNFRIHIPRTAVPQEFSINAPKTETRLQTASI